MKKHDISKFKYNHDFFSDKKNRNEKRTIIVAIMTVIFMFLEIIVGYKYGSIALLADGWHMSTHFIALSIAIIGYKYARKNRDNPKFTFGTGKVNDLTGFASAIFLFSIALLMIVESGRRLFNPVEIDFGWSISVAIIGLLVNLISFIILSVGGGHNHSYGGDEYSHSHSDVGEDHNFKAVMMHVLTDALTSVGAIVAILASQFLRIKWLDPIIGALSAVLIIIWAFKLIRVTSRILLDRDIPLEFVNKVKEVLESDGESDVIDLHIWKVSQEVYYISSSIVNHDNKDTLYYKDKLKSFDNIKHATIEVNRCDDPNCEAN